MRSDKIKRDDKSLVQYIKSKPGINSRQLSKRLKLPASEAHRLLALASGTQLTKSSSLSRAAFQAMYDHDTRQRECIRAGVKSLTNPDEIVEEAEFRKRCSAHTNRFRQVAEEAEFRPYQFMAGGKVHWAHPETKKWAMANVEGTKDL